jgi:hypothetical protein
MFDEARRYVQTILQAGVPLVDADYNDQMDSTFTQLRRIIQSALGDGALGDAFLISQNLPNLVNEFLINGGNVLPAVNLTVNADKTVVLPQPGPEGMFNKGHHAQLWADETFMSGGQTAPISTAFIQTVLPNDTLVDTAADFTPGALVGRILTPDLAVPANAYAIVANTATTIRVGVTMVAAVGAQYRVGLTTPLANRKDLVYLDCYLDEVNPTEDTDLKHTVDSMQIEAMFRWKLVQTVKVEEGIVLPYVMPSGWTDTDGNPHVVVPLALIERPAGNPTITDAMITDLRRKLFRLDEIDDRFVNVTGDTMTGTLVMQANITLALGRRVLGTCIIDGNALCEDTVAQRHMKRDSHLLGDLDEVPNWSEVNDPLDPRYFKVHDDRYYRKSQIDSILGSNLVSNGLFEDGFTGWENAAPQPLYGYPPEEAERVIVSMGMCGSLCGEDLCGCKSLELHFPASNRSCVVCVVRQEVCGGIKCGGEFLLIETVCVTKGEEAVIPLMVLDLYSSCQYVGTRTYRMWEPSTFDPEKPGLTIQDGITRLEKLIELPKCIDNVILTLCFEIVPLHELPPVPPPPPECDICRQGPPLMGQGGALWACIENPVQITPFAMCRYFDPAIDIGPNITLDLQSNRPSAPVRIMLVDADGKRAYYDHVTSGAVETLVINTGDFTIPDGMPDFTRIVSWCIYWMEPLAHDEYAIDNWLSNNGSVVVESWDDVEALFEQQIASCGYFSEPEAPRGIQAPRMGVPRQPEPDPNPLAPACEVGPDAFEIAVCAAQIRRVSGPEGEIDPGIGCKTNKIPVITRVNLDGTVEFVPAHNQVQTVLEVLEEECQGPQ